VYLKKEWRMTIMYDRNEVMQSTLDYFSGDELAANVWVSKYALKDKEGNLMEKNPSDMHKRIAREFARMEKKFSNGVSGAGLTEEEIFEQLDKFRYIVPQGSPMMGIGNNYVNVSLSNCVVVDSPTDTISSIIDAGKELANLFKRRCGVGLDISELRPDGTPVNNSAGTTTGAWSFADFYSYVCRMIGQNNRRGALMISLDVRHPDIYKFVRMKEDLVKVTGANVSVRITDDFMNAVEKGQTFTLRWPVNSKTPKITHEIEARDLWDTIVAQATKNAEPGILMWDNILRFMPAESYADVGFKTISTNPCSEIPLSAYDSCRLISINLKNFVTNKFTDKASFDFGAFEKTAKMAQRLSDDLVELEIEKLNGIVDVADTKDEKEMWLKLLEAAKNGRRTGLGTHGLADALACMCLKYDSDEALPVIDKIYEHLKLASYWESMNLAKQRGPFKVWDWEKEKDNEFIKTLPNDLLAAIKAYGRRNIANLTNAPTGSVSLVSQTSSGLEPVFKNLHIRRKKRNHNEEVLADDFIDNVGDRWQEFKVFHYNVRDYINTTGKDTKIPDYFVESDQIDWMRRVEIQGIIQKHIDHAISSTINLPKGTPPEVVGKLYFEGWKKGLKGITVYVDGSRTGVLVAEKKSESFNYRDAVKRPDVLPCHIHQVNVKGEKWTILVGLMDGRPYEVFGGLSELIEIPKQHTEGVLIKATRSKIRSRYDLQFGQDGWLIKDVTKVFDNVAYQVHTRMVSLALRHGAKPSFLVEQLQKDPDSDITSFSKVLARVLKKYIEDGTKVTSDKSCPSCNSESLIYQEGCMTCKDCGYAKCG
jgi:ribonucleoside-diphosphate reductase alpha chain